MIVWRFNLNNPTKQVEAKIFSVQDRFSVQRILVILVQYDYTVEQYDVTVE